jgi:hypothetical protein
MTVELPGVKLDDLQITLEDGLLTIQGERHFAHDSSDQRFHRVERRYGAFRRSITLPTHVQADAVEATVEDGVLQIMVPKAEEAKPKRIQVRPGGASRMPLQAPRPPADHHRVARREEPSGPPAPPLRDDGSHKGVHDDPAPTTLA